MRLTVAALERLRDHLAIERNVAAMLIRARSPSVRVIALLIFPAMSRQFLRKLPPLIARAEDGKRNIG
jgi:hypothetical protein